MNIKLYLISIYLLVFYNIFRLFNKRNDVLFIYSDSSNIYRNLDFVYDGLIKCDIVVKKASNNYSIRTLMLIAKSKFIIIDQSVKILSLIKLKDTDVLQLWHGGGLFKKVAYDLCINDYERKLIDRKYRNITYLNISSGSLVKEYSQMFNIDDKKITLFGMPRIDVFYNNLYMDRIKSKYSDVIKLNKKIVLFAPTYQINGKTLNNSIDIEYIQSKLKDYIVLTSFHPNLGNKVCSDILPLVDILITDFSSILFDFSFFKKTIILYIKNVDYNLLYVKPSELVGDNFVCKNEDEVIELIKSNKKSIIQDKIFDSYMNCCNGFSTVNIVNFIINKLKGI